MSADWLVHCAGCQQELTTALRPIKGHQPVFSEADGLYFCKNCTRALYSFVLKAEAGGSPLQDVIA